MSTSSYPISDWDHIKNFLPRNWESSCKSHNTLKGNRKIKSASSLLRLLFLHVGKGYSLSETSVRSKLSNLLDISDVGVLNILRRSEPWLRDMCKKLYYEQEGINKNIFSGKKKMRLIDGSIVKEPGKTGSQWRINYSFSLPNFECDYFDLVSTKGKGNGESVTRYPLEKGECVIADRGYSTAKEILYTQEKKADIIVRVNTQALPLYNKDGTKFDLLSHLSKLDGSHDYDEWPVCIKDKQSNQMAGRICAIRKSDQAIQEATKRVKAKASKKCIKNTKPETFEYAKYIILFTSLSKDEYSTLSVLEWYRIRWQIELAFKRLKTITSLGHLPKHDDRSARAWIYGKLLIGLLTEKLIRHAKTVSPWGYCFS